MSGRAIRPTPRVLRLLAWGYAVKTLLVALVCFLAPELPARALAEARAAWVRTFADTP